MELAEDAGGELRTGGSLTSCEARPRRHTRVRRGSKDLRWERSQRNRRSPPPPGRGAEPHSVICRPEGTNASGSSTKSTQGEGEVKREVREVHLSPPCLQLSQSEPGRRVELAVLTSHGARCFTTWLRPEKPRGCLGPHCRRERTQTRFAGAGERAAVCLRHVWFLRAGGYLCLHLHRWVSILRLGRHETSLCQVPSLGPLFISLGFVLQPSLSDLALSLAPLEDLRT